MAHYNFCKDLKQSQIGVNVVVEHLKSPDGGYADWDVEEYGKDKQHLGDVGIQRDTGLGEEGFNIEVKYDIMAQNTGNLCFEASNGKKDTGILATESDEVWYVVPDEDEHFVIYKFVTKHLVDFLKDEKNADKIRKVKGGDRRRFTLMLVKREYAGDSVAYEMVKV